MLLFRGELKASSLWTLPLWTLPTSGLRRSQSHHCSADLDSATTLAESLSWLRRSRGAAKAGSEGRCCATNGENASSRRRSLAPMIARPRDLMTWHGGAEREAR